MFIKKVVCLLLVFLCVLMFSSCDSSYEISGLDRFNENICSMGTCDGLLPADSMFISNQPYEDGDFYYWTDGNYTQAKAFVRLQYSEDIYLFKKTLNEIYYDFSEIQYEYEGFIFSAPNILFEATETSPSHGIQMYGYNDATRTFIFISSYGYDFDRSKNITQSLFEEFFREEFEGYL